FVKTEVTNFLHQFTPGKIASIILDAIRSGGTGPVTSLGGVTSQFVQAAAKAFLDLFTLFLQTLTTPTRAIGGNPTQTEVYQANAVVNGNPSDALNSIDNLHQTSDSSVQEPSIFGPGGATAVHWHWRWTDLASSPLVNNALDSLGGFMKKIEPLVAKIPVIG